MKKEITPIDRNVWKRLNRKERKNVVLLQDILEKRMRCLNGKTKPKGKRPKNPRK